MPRKLAKIKPNDGRALAEKRSHSNDFTVFYRSQHISPLMLTTASGDSNNSSPPTAFGSSHAPPTTYGAASVPPPTVSVLPPGTTTSAPQHAKSREVFIVTVMTNIMSLAASPESNMNLSAAEIRYLQEISGSQVFTHDRKAQEYFKQCVDYIYSTYINYNKETGTESSSRDNNFEKQGSPDYRIYQHRFNGGNSVQWVLNIAHNLEIAAIISL